jgi:CRISPR-associated protein Csd2
MSDPNAAPIQDRYDFLLLFDVEMGNPNGDPDAGNQPRLDPQTGHGLVTDVCLKRKVRDYVALRNKLQPPFDIYVKHRGILANEQRSAFKALGAEPSESPNLEARSWMCRNYFDVRAFGAVMTTGKAPASGADSAARKEKKKLWNCGQVRGPVQLTFASSVDPVLSLEHSITRVALTNVGDTGREVSESEGGEEKAGSGQMGRKNTIPYGLYRARGFVSAALAADTGFCATDLEVLWEALVNMFEHDRSAARGLMATRQLYIFKHDGPLGNAPAHVLFDKVSVARKDPKAPARGFSDYCVSVSRDLPKGVALIERL